MLSYSCKVIFYVINNISRHITQEYLSLFTQRRNLYMYIYQVIVTSTNSFIFDFRNSDKKNRPRTISFLTYFENDYTITLCPYVLKKRYYIFLFRYQNFSYFIYCWLFIGYSLLQCKILPISIYLLLFHSKFIDIILFY